MAKYRSNAQINSQFIRIRKSTYWKLKSLCLEFGKDLVDLVDQAVGLLEMELKLRPAVIYSYTEIMLASIFAPSTPTEVYNPGILSEVYKSKEVSYV